MKKRIALLCLSLSVIAVGACTSHPSPEGKPMPGMTFNHLGPMKLKVAEVLHAESMAANNAFPIDFSVPLDDYLKLYINRRFQPFGGTETLTITAEDVQVVHTLKDSESGMANFIGVAKVDSYAVTVVINMSLEDKHTGSLRGRRFTAKRVINVSEHASIAEREKRQMEGIEALFANIDASALEILKNQYDL